MVVSIGLLALINKPILGIAMSLACAVLIFTLGSRGEFYGFIFAIVLLEGVTLINKPAAVISIVAVGLVAVALLLWKYDVISFSRQLAVFKLSSDVSWNDRESITGLAIGQILQHPIFGAFAGHFKVDFEGNYAHNMLSAWVSFGLVGFILYAAICFVSFLISLNGCIRKNVTSY